MKKLLAMIIALVLAFGLVPVTVLAADNNLITNGNFETAYYTFYTHKAKNWDTKNSYNRTTDITGSGQGYIMSMESETSGLANCLHDSITIKSDTYYCYSAKIYRTDATGAIYVDILDTQGKQVDGAIISTTETGKWVTVSCIFNSGSHTSVRPRLVVTGDRSGKAVYFDDVELTELAFPQKSTVSAPKAAFTVASDTTEASFAVTDNRLYMTELFSHSNSGFKLLSVKVIGDYQLELKFSEVLSEATGNGTKTWPEVMNDRINLQMGVAFVKNGATGDEGFGNAVVGDHGTGTVEWGATHDTLIWTADKKDTTISTLLEQTKAGYTKRFYFYDNGNGWGNVGAIDAVQNADGKALSIPGAHYSNKAYEYLFMDITQPQEIALVKRISNKEVTWNYNGYEAIAIDSGTEHVVTYQSTDAKYKLRAVITQRNGVGPIEFNQYITGLTEGISVAYSDIISANVAVKADGAATLYRFSRSRVNNGKDPYFSQGVLKDTLQAGSSVFSSVENHHHPVESILPYQVLDIDGTHGVYFGHYWSFGKMLVRMNEYNEVAFTAYLGENSNKKIVREKNEELSIPGFFIGTYEGSVDDGSNQMKDWFWNHKMTRTLYENENEPYIEIGVLGDRVAGIDKLFDIWPDLAEYVNVLKLDFGWTLPDEVPSRSDKETEQKWVPNSEKKEYVQSDGTINMGIYDAIQRNLTSDESDKEIFFSLYMPDTFEGVDIGTKEGREKQLEALKIRMRPEDNDWGVGYDYWRSDYEVEQSYDYDDHEGLLYILDEMIKYSEDFRYEHCMGGGSLKDFTTLERMTFMTTEDTSLPLNHRMSLYANTYMINPLQLKGDISMSLTSRNYEDAIGGDILASGQPGYTDETYVKYALRTGMLGAMMVSFGEQGYQYGNNLEIIKEHYDLYNNTHREILRNTNVYHILASPTGWDYADWDGIEYYNSNINKGVVQLFKENATAPDSKTITLDGLDENTLYKLTFVDRTEQNTIMSGADLMADGLTVTGMDAQYASELIYIEPFSQAQIGDDTYERLEDALNAATVGQTVLLNGNVDVATVNVSNGITLDLNGHVLTADMVIAIGNIIDSSEGDGGIAIAKNDVNDSTHSLILPADNAMMPLYEDDFGYRFFTCTMTQLYKTDVCKFGFQVNMNAKAYELLKDAANTDVEIMTKLIATVDGVQKMEKNYAFKTDTVAEYANKKLDEPNKNWAITLTVNGLDKVHGTDICMTSTPSFVSSTGVIVIPTTDATVTYIHHPLGYKEEAGIW